MEEQELQEFSLEDIIKEFSEMPADEEIVEAEQTAEEILAEEIPEAPETAEEETAAPITDETIRMEIPASEEAAAPVTGDTIVLELPAEVQEEAVTGDTIRMDVIATEETEETAEEAAPVEEAPAQEAFEEGWEPEYDEPIAEYVPPRPILVHPRSRLRELKKKLVAGPEKQYYAMLEKGFGKLQAAIVFSLLVALISGGATIMYAMGAVAEHRMRLMVFGQFFALLVSALFGCFQMIEGLADMKNNRFSLNSLLVFSFVLCCVDGVLCEVEQKGNVFGDCYFDCGSFHFGSKERKMLRKIRFTGEGTFACTVKTDGVARTETLAFTGGSVEWNLRENGREFGVLLTLGDGAKIRSMAAEVEFI